MANNLIQIKRTSVPGRAANTSTLTNPGELALNMADGILYSTNGSVVFEIGANNTNAEVTGNLTVNVIIANGSSGTPGQVLTTNSSGVYWSTVTSGGGFSNGQSISVNDFEVTGSFTASGNTGNPGQVLTSSGSGVYWNDVLGAFPVGDYGDLSGAGYDAFGVPLLATYDCNAPGSIIVADLN
jgi:hypothetical protein